MTRVVIVGEIFQSDLSVGGGPMPGGGWGGPVDPGYGRPGWSPADPGYGHPTFPHPGHGLPGGGHISTGPVYPPGHPAAGFPIAPGHPGNALPWAPARPDQGLPPGVETWPPANSAGTLPAEPGMSPENPIVVPPPPDGTVVLVWVSGVGYRYVTIGEAEPK